MKKFSYDGLANIVSLKDKILSEIYAIQAVLPGVGRGGACKG